MRLREALLLASLCAHPARSQVTLAYTGSLINNVAGGEMRGSVFQHAALANFAVDLRKWLGWKGASFFTSLLGTSGTAPDSLVGDIQGVLSTVAPSGIRVEEVWLQQNAANNRFSLLVGRYDINSEFYRLASASIFLNSSFGIGPELSLSGVAGPSTYPLTSAGLRVIYKATPNSVLRAAVMDGVPVDRPDGGIHLFAPGDGVFSIGEFALLSRPDTAALMPDLRFRIGRGNPRPYSSKIALGAWNYSATGTSGAYVIGDGTIWSDSTKHPRALTAFAQLGLGDPHAIDVGGYIGAGITLTGPATRRPGDQLGFGVASALIGSPLPDTAPTETTFELTYIAQLASWIGLHLDLQYVIHPSGSVAIHNALVPGIQFAISRNF